MRSVRVFFEKRGNLKFVSHLDLNRFMLRMIRLSEIPVWYSEGFNPHPYITFALPLSLGFESSYEIMDIRLDDDNYPCSDVLKRLSALMPEGIKIFKCDYPIMKSGDISSAEFYLDFGADFSSISSAFSEFIHSRSIITEKKTKKGGVKTVDIKDFIKSWDIREEGVGLILAAGGSQNLNPKLLMDTFSDKFGIELPPYSVTRTGLFNEKMELFV